MKALSMLFGMLSNKVISVRSRLGKLLNIVKTSLASFIKNKKRRTVVYVHLYLPDSPAPGSSLILTLQEALALTATSCTRRQIVAAIRRAFSVKL